MLYFKKLWLINDSTSVNLVCEFFDKTNLDSHYVYV